MSAYQGTHILVLSTFSLLLTCYGDYVYETKSINVPVDHFSFANNKTFDLRYLFNDTFWRKNGSIFFYTGNEGDITVFAQNTGFVWETAPLFNALIVFAEHRYYGTSLPYGNKSFADPKHLGYLTSTQALADYVYLIEDIQLKLAKKNENNRSPVIAFGGSYGGMLAAWIRLKYPGSVYGALASSAPIYQFPGLVKCNVYNKILVSVYDATAGPTCVGNIKSSWKTIRDITSTDDGKAWLSSKMKLCNPLKSEDDVNKLTDWITDIYSNLAMVNYPYPTKFLAPLPAYPVRAFCKEFSQRNVSGKPLLEALSKALSIYTNFTGKVACVNYNQSSASVDENAWDYQACTEMIMPMCNNDNEMFEKASWNFTEYSEQCFKRFGVKVAQDDIAVLEYGGKDALYSNVIFTNGLLDPWSGGGVVKPPPGCYSIMIPDAAHHLDLRASNQADPESVWTTRQMIKKIIKNWLQEFKQM